MTAQSFSHTISTKFPLDLDEQKTSEGNLPHNSYQRYIELRDKSLLFVI